VTTHFKGLERHTTVNGVNIIRVPVILRKELEVATLPSMLSYFPASVLSSLRNLRKEQFDIINTHFAIPSGPTGFCVSKVFRLPNVLSIHGGDIFDPSKSLSPHQMPILSHTVRAMLSRADRVVAQSSDTRNNAYRYYGVDRPIDVIPLGINKSVFERKTRSQFNIDSDDFVFCTIGRLIRRKNIDDILTVLSEMNNSHKFKLVIIGDGPQRDHLRELVSRLDLAGKVIMAGNVSDEEKFQLLDVSNCYLSTAFHEGFGLVFLEAMEAGIPVICYDRGGQNDFLVSGKTGFIVELGDKNKFSEKILELVHNPELHTNIGAYNRQLVQNYYISACAEKYITLFDETIAKYRNERMYSN
jgi:glycosyltransferase involved in cell wall biosynthesis